MGNTSSLHRKLDIISPVPSDIDIAQAVTPHDITRITDHLGLKANEFESHGAHKAKVSPSAPRAAWETSCPPEDRFSSLERAFHCPGERGAWCR